jgi:hypothetical protein
MLYTMRSKGRKVVMANACRSFRRTSRHHVRKYCCSDRVSHMFWFLLNFEVQKEGHIYTPAGVFWFPKKNKVCWKEGEKAAGRSGFIHCTCGWRQSGHS